MDDGSSTNDKGGRPSKYEPDFAKQARKLCTLGAIDRDLAYFFGVTSRTIDRWKVHHPEFCRALRVGKVVPNQRVLRALYQRAIGFTQPEVKVMQYEGKPVYADFDAYYPPDVKACMSWLSNRMGWRMNPAGPEMADTPTPKGITVTVVDGRRPHTD